MVLRGKGIVATRRDGQSVFYRPASSKVIQACDLMRQVLLEQLKQGGHLARTVRG